MREKFVTTNGVKLHVVESGPENGQLVVLLHGFPEFWYSWRHQIEALGQAGYCVVAPDQRGYHLSDKPAHVADYTLDVLAKDIEELIQAYGREKAIVVGHDWGAAVAWWMGIQNLKCVERLVLLNVPHPIVLNQTLRRSVKQLCRSWYMFFFQLPRIPEAVFAASNFKIGTDGLVHSSRPGTFSADDLEKYRNAWRQPGALRSMINWYRAAVRKPARVPRGGRVTVPTLLIWGAKDKFLSREMAKPSIDFCENGSLVFIDEATHWVHEEEPGRVNDLLVKFSAS